MRSDMYIGRNLLIQITCQRKTESTYYTRKEQSEYVERRVSEGYGRWQAKKEAREGKLVPPEK